MVWSAIGRLRDDRVLALSDNTGTVPARVYEIALSGDDAQVVDMTTLKRPNGTPYNGTDFDGEGPSSSRTATPIIASS